MSRFGLHLNFEKIKFQLQDLQDLQLTKNHLLAAFGTLPKHTNQLRPNFFDLTIPYFDHNLSYIFYSFCTSIKKVTYSSLNSFFNH